MGAEQFTRAHGLQMRLPLCDPVNGMHILTLASWSWIHALYLHAVSQLEQPTYQRTTSLCFLYTIYLRTPESTPVLVQPYPAAVPQLRPYIRPDYSTHDTQDMIGRCYDRVKPRHAHDHIFKPGWIRCTGVGVKNERYHILRNGRDEGGVELVIAVIVVEEAGRSGQESSDITRTCMRQV